MVSPRVLTAGLVDPRRAKCRQLCCRRQLSLSEGLAVNAIAPRNGGRIESTFQSPAAPAVVVGRVFGGVHLSLCSFGR